MKTYDYEIKNFLIHIEDVAESQRQMKEFAKSVCAECYSDDRDFIENVVTMLQFGFGIEIGFNDSDLKLDVELQDLD